MVNRSAASASVLKEPSIELKSRIDEALTMLCAEHLLPYSFVEWPAMRMLMARLLESGGVAVSVLLLVFCPCRSYLCYTPYSFTPLAGVPCVAV